MNVNEALNYVDRMQWPPDYITSIAAEVRRLRDENMSLLGIIADIRAAVGDPSGVMMLSELIEHCREIYVDADRLRERETKARELADKFLRSMDNANSTIAQAVAATELRDSLRRWLETE